MRNADQKQLEKDLKVIHEICERYGWELAIPHGDDNDEVPGLIIGTAEYINFILDEDVPPKDQQN